LEHHSRKSSFSFASYFCTFNQLQESMCQVVNDPLWIPGAPRGIFDLGVRVGVYRTVLLLTERVQPQFC
jgi:hypothetical protein